MLRVFRGGHVRVCGRGEKLEIRAKRNPFILSQVKGSNGFLAPTESVLYLLPEVRDI